MNSYHEMKNRLQQDILQKLEMTGDIDNLELQHLIDECILKECNQISIRLGDRCRLRKEIFNSIRKMDILQELLEDENISEIMINGKDNIFVEKSGKITVWEDHFESHEKLETIIQHIVSKGNRIVNEQNPIVDVRLEDGSRVNVVLPPVALDGPAVTIRKFPEHPFTMDSMIKIGTITEEAAEFLEKLVTARYNIFISGGTGSGKTTFLNALSNYIPADERVITIEDSAELQIRNIKNLVRLETRNANIEGNNEITIRHLIKSALRMRPDRIIVGEIRDSAAVDMLSAFNTGHDGSLSTGHANSPMDMLNRMETLVLMGMDIPLLAIRQQIASAIDIIVHVGRMRDKSRKVLEIDEVLGIEEGQIKMNVLYRFQEANEKDGKIIGTLMKQAELSNVEKLRRAGVLL